MASSGSFSGSICSGHYVLRIDWSQAQNVSANTSTITQKSIWSMTGVWTLALVPPIP